MTDTSTSNDTQSDYKEKHAPPGKLKIMEALRTLLEEKEFVSLTIAEIAKTAGVTEGLIYKYFHDKRDLLHQVLSEYVAYFVDQVEAEVKSTDRPLNKLRKLIRVHVYMYAHNRVFARILLLEVRNYADYFNSAAYETVRRYTDILTQIVQQGMEDGSIRRDVPCQAIRQIVLGAIEHVCLPGVIFNRTIEPDVVSDQICEVLFTGIATEVPGRG